MKLPNNIKKIFKLFQQFDKQIYLIGGCVRDIIMGNIPHDYDFTTDATPDEMKEIAKSANVEIIPTGEKYGTLTFHVDNEFYEITTFRADGNYSDGRRPDEVVFSKNLEDDLCRRDFTFNAMCFAFDKKTNGVKLIDLYNGRKDIGNKIVKTIGNAEDRFNEDALRILRAIRFAYKFGFQLSMGIKRAIIRQVDLLSNVSMERIREEIFKILDYHKNISTENEQVLRVVLKKILGGNAIEFVDTFDKKLSIETKILNILNRVGDRNFIFDKLKELKCSNEFIKNSLTIYDCAKHLELSKREDNLNLHMKWCLNRCDKNKDLLIQAIILFINNNVEFLFDGDIYFQTLENILENQEPVTLKELAVNGDDLINWGIKGKEVGRLLETIQRKVWLDPAFNVVEIIKEFVTSYDCN